MGTDPCTSWVETGQYSGPELYSNGNLRMDLPGHALLGDHGRNTTESALELGWHGRLHAHLDRLEGTQSYVGDELSRGTGS